MTDQVAVDDGAAPMWVADVAEWRRVLQEHGWSARPRGPEWVWEEPDLGQHDDDAEEPRYPYTEACGAYRLPVEWWDDLSEEEQQAMPEFRFRPDIGPGAWTAPFGPSEE